MKAIDAWKQGMTEKESRAEAKRRRCCIRRAKKAQETELLRNAQRYEERETSSEQYALQEELQKTRQKQTTTNEIQEI